MVFFSYVTPSALQETRISSSNKHQLQRSRRAEFKACAVLCPWDFLNNNDATHRRADKSISYDLDQGDRGHLTGSVFTDSVATKTVSLYLKKTRRD